MSSSKKSFRIDVLLAPARREVVASPPVSPSSSTPSRSSLSPPISPGSEAAETNSKSNSPVVSIRGLLPFHAHHNSHTLDDYHHAHHHHHAHHLASGGGGQQQHHQINPAVVSAAAAARGLFPYSSGGASGLNHFPTSSAFHLPAHLHPQQQQQSHPHHQQQQSSSSGENGGGGGGGDMKRSSSSSPSSQQQHSHFVGLSVANAHHLQLEWLARNGMLYPRLPDLTGEYLIRISNNLFNTTTRIKLWNKCDHWRRK
ncbi:hypothetical protein Fcan01_26723 [Folsomia candida]|uniref:Uncharacterized protein n=1 Tax=Folsomia candida TaxID=158441 RepID=A0A226D0W1_FOLCA|nr:hypothetical protein Fcan01_26723 [Folsomia candida]